MFRWNWALASSDSFHLFIWDTVKISVNYFSKGGPSRVEKCTKPCKAIGPPKKATTCNHMWAKLMKKIQPAVPTFLAVAMSFAVQGDWAIAFCRQFVFFFPGPKAGGLYKPSILCLICRLFFLRFLFLFLLAFFPFVFPIVLFVLRSSFLCFLEHQSVPI